jgi:hypothetical protein
MLKNLSDIPGYKKTIDESSDLITSDSNFEIAAGEGHGEGKNIIPPAKKKVNLKKDVQKTFKKMLMQNNKRDRENLNGDHQSNESTKFGGSLKNEDFNSEIESKFTKRKMKKSLQKIHYKEDEDPQFVREDKDNVAPVFRKPQDDGTYQLQEHINTKRPKDPFRDLDPLT